MERKERREKGREEEREREREREREKAILQAENRKKSMGMTDREKV